MAAIEAAGGRAIAVRMDITREDEVHTGFARAREAFGGLDLLVNNAGVEAPFALVDINGMQLMQVVHSVIGIVFIAGILAHIYIGTLGMKGAYDAMGSGKVDLAWARAHHDLWVEQEQAHTASGPQLGSRPAPAE